MANLRESLLIRMNTFDDGSTEFTVMSMEVPFVENFTAAPTLAEAITAARAIAAAGPGGA